jgi:hypothetical protein
LVYELAVYLSSRQGATHAQARAALKKYKDVMQAAERFFEGKFDHIKDEDEDIEMASCTAELRSFRPSVHSLHKELDPDCSYALQTPDDDEGMSSAEDQDDGDDGMTFYDHLTGRSHSFRCGRL